MHAGGPPGTGVEGPNLFASNKIGVPTARSNCSSSAAVVLLKHELFSDTIKMRIARQVPIQIREPLPLLR